MKRFVFDLDGTLLTGSFDFEHDYFTSVYGDEASDLISNMGVYLDEYERNYKRYNHKDLSHFLTCKSGILISDDVIDGWIETMNDVPDTLEDGIMETLDYLKTHGHSLAVLTNWYGRTQIPRLKKADMFQYFDDIYTGDVILKPHKEAYLFARKDFDSDDCIFVGDNVDKDYIGPRACGMKSLLYDKNEKYHSSIQKIKKMNELIKISCDK